MGAWPQFRSPLVWDFFAVATYFIVSLLFILYFLMTGLHAIHLVIGVGIVGVMSFLAWR